MWPYTGHLKLIPSRPVVFSTPIAASLVLQFSFSFTTALISVLLSITKVKYTILKCISALVLAKTTLPSECYDMQVYLDHMH